MGRQSLGRCEVRGEPIVPTSSSRQRGERPIMALHPHASRPGEASCGCTLACNCRSVRFTSVLSSLLNKGRVSLCFIPLIKPVLCFHWHSSEEPACGHFRLRTGDTGDTADDSAVDLPLQNPTDSRICACQRLTTFHWQEYRTDLRKGYHDSRPHSAPEYHKDRIGLTVF